MTVGALALGGLVWWYAGGFIWLHRKYKSKRPLIVKKTELQKGDVFKVPANYGQPDLQDSIGFVMHTYDDGRLVAKIRKKNETVSRQFKNEIGLRKLPLIPLKDLASSNNKLSKGSMVKFLLNNQINIGIVEEMTNTQPPMVSIKYFKGIGNAEQKWSGLMDNVWLIGD